MRNVCELGNGANGHQVDANVAAERDGTQGHSTPAGISERGRQHRKGYDGGVGKDDEELKMAKMRFRVVENHAIPSREEEEEEF